MRPSAPQLCQLVAQVRCALDHVRNSSRRGAPLVWLVKADESCSQLTLHQARKLLRLDFYRSILSESIDTHHIYLFGFPRSTATTADLEADMMATLRSLRVKAPDHIVRNSELSNLEQRLSESSAVVVDLSAGEPAEDDAASPVRDVLKSQPAHLLRLTELLQAESSELAESAQRFHSSYFTAVDSYVCGNLAAASPREDGQCDSRLLEIIAEQDLKFVACFENLQTRKAMDALWEAMVLTRPMLDSAERRPSVVAVLAARALLLRRLDTLGVHADPQEAAGAELDGRVSSILDAAAGFRREVRQFALQDRESRGQLVTACDTLRQSLSGAGVRLQDKKNQAPWLWASKSTPKR